MQRVAILNFLTAARKKSNDYNCYKVDEYLSIIQLSIFDKLKTSSVGACHLDF